MVKQAVWPVAAPVVQSCGLVWSSRQLSQYYSHLVSILGWYGQAGIVASCSSGWFSLVGWYGQAGSVASSSPSCSILWIGMVKQAV